MTNENYKNMDDLPGTLRSILPSEAQEIYLKAYQKSWENYKPAKGGEMGQHGVAHRNAMHAVLEEYTFDQSTGVWSKRGEKEAEEEDQNLFDTIIERLEDILTAGERQDQNGFGE